MTEGPYDLVVRIALRGLALFIVFVVADGIVAALVLSGGLGLASAPSVALTLDGVELLFAAGAVFLPYLVLASVAVALSSVRLRSGRGALAALFAAVGLTLSVPTVLALSSAGVPFAVASVLRYVVVAGLLMWLLLRRGLTRPEDMP